tara:strand:- start:1963 stop:2238 length:276 start_codon:yes stop_codon:yes gene_type:complete
MKRVKHVVGEHMVHLGWALWGQGCDCEYGHFYAPLANFRWKQEDKKYANITEEEIEEIEELDMAHGTSLFFKVTSWMVNTGTNWTVPEFEK